MLEELQARLDDLCHERFGASAQVARLHEITSGAENRVFSLDLERPNQPVLGLIWKHYSSAEGARCETAILRALPEQGFPAPELFHVELDPENARPPASLMRRIEGRTLGAVMRETRGAEAASWLRRFAELAARLHALDAAAFAPATKSADAHLDDALARYQRALRDLQVPEFQPVFDWLLERRRSVGARGPALIHQDYHPLNVLVDERGELYLLDWSLGHVSDPRTDLAQTFQMLASSGFGTLRAPIVDAYEAAAGWALSDMDFFDAFALLKNVAGQFAVLDAGEQKRPELWARLSRRPNWSERARQLHAALPGLERTYRALVQLTGVPVPAAERLFQPSSASG